MVLNLKSACLIFVSLLFTSSQVVASEGCIQSLIVAADKASVLKQSIIDSIKSSERLNISQKDMKAVDFGTMANESLILKKQEATLAKIEEKLRKKIELNVKDLNFIYEVDSNIDARIKDKDLRLAKIISQENRYISLDLKRIFEEKIANEDAKHFVDITTLSRKSVFDLLLRGEVKYLKGDITLTLSEASLIKAWPIFIDGHITIAESLMRPGNSHMENIEMSRYVSGSLRLARVRSSKNNKYPRYIGGSVSDRTNWNSTSTSLATSENDTLPAFVGERIYLEGIISAVNTTFPIYANSVFFNNLEEVEGQWVMPVFAEHIEFSSLKSVDNVKFPLFANSFDISSVKEIKRKIFPSAYIKELNPGPYDNSIRINIKSTEILDRVVFPKEVYAIDTEKLTAVFNTVFPKIVNYNFHMYGVTQIENSHFPEGSEFNSTMRLLNLVNANDFTMPEVVHTMELRALEDISAVGLPKKITGNKVEFNAIKNLDGKIIEFEGSTSSSVHPSKLNVRFSALESISNSEFIGDMDLEINTAKTIVNTKFSENFGNIEALNVTSIIDWTPPVKVNNLYLDSMQSLIGVAMPKIVEENAIFNSLVSSDDSSKKTILPERVGILRVNNIKHGRNIVFPVSVYAMEAGKMEDASGTVFPKRARKGIALQSLVTDIGLDFSNTEFDKDAIVYLNSLESIDRDAVGYQGAVVFN